MSFVRPCSLVVLQALLPHRGRYALGLQERKPILLSVLRDLIEVSHAFVAESREFLEDLLPATTGRTLCLRLDFLTGGTRVFD